MLYSFINKNQRKRQEKQQKPNAKQKTLQTTKTKINLKNSPELNLSKGDKPLRF